MFQVNLKGKKLTVYKLRPNSLYFKVVGLKAICGELKLLKMAPTSTERLETETNLHDTKFCRKFAQTNLFKVISAWKLK